MSQEQPNRVAQSRANTLLAIERHLLSVPKTWHGSLLFKVHVQDGVAIRAEVTPTESIKLTGT